MLTIIAGKPGSGKSYHMATLLVDMLTDWVRYELKHGELYDSLVYTNIVFREEGLNEAVSKRVGQEVDAWKYVFFCDDAFFRDPDCTYWWQKFPVKSVVVLDEVHKYLAKSMDYGSLDLERELTNWISTHRHAQQALYFLTQHTDQFANTVLGIADELLEIVNIKSLTLAWPLSIPMADLEELKRSFGIKTQYYQANVGNFRGKALKWSGASHRKFMSADIFKVYKSHDSGLEESDRPSLKMSPLDGVLWFARRHGWHLGLKAGALFVVVFGGISLLFRLPTILGDSVNLGAGIERAVGHLSPQPAVVSKVSGAVSHETVSEVVSRVPVHSSVSEHDVDDVLSVSVPAVLPVPVKPKKIVMLFMKGVMFDDGTKIMVGETFDYEGVSETLSVSCPVCGVVGFESGKRMKF
jgi:adenosyl cobinamide kinase/adenosyl cobinamide phosphate guanylyltransferase